MCSSEKFRQRRACSSSTWSNLQLDQELRCKTEMAGAFRGFRPLLDRVLVERLAPEAKTKSGLYIPEKAQGKVNEATVVAIGEGTTDKKGNTLKMNVRVGDKVLVPEYGGTKLTFEEKDYYLFRDGDILGVFDS